MKRLPETLSDHPSLIGILRMPKSVIDVKVTEIPVLIRDGDSYKQAMQQVQIAQYITSLTPSAQSNTITIDKNKFTDFYPYTYYVLTDGESEPLILKPQYLPSSVYISSKFALSNQPIERYFVPGYKNDNDGRIYNITNINQMMLPTGTNEGLNFLNANSNTLAQTRKNTIGENILNGVRAIGGTATSLATGNIVGAIGGALNGGANAISGLNNIKAIDARNNDAVLTPNSISSFGTPSTRDSFENNEVRLLKYTIEDKYKNKVNNFVDRFGYKYNNYGVIDLKSYKGFIKFISPDVDGNIDNEHMNKIINILERGVYIE